MMKMFQQTVLSRFSNDWDEHKKNDTDNTYIELLYRPAGLSVQLTIESIPGALSDFGPFFRQ